MFLFCVSQALKNSHEAPFLSPHYFYMRTWIMTCYSSVRHSALKAKPQAPFQSIFHYKQSIFLKMGRSVNKPYPIGFIL